MAIGCTFIATRFYHWYDVHFLKSESAIEIQEYRTKKSIFPKYAPIADTLKTMISSIYKLLQGSKWPPSLSDFNRYFVDLQLFPDAEIQFEIQLRNGSCY